MSDTCQQNNSPEVQLLHSLIDLLTVCHRLLMMFLPDLTVQPYSSVIFHSLLNGRLNISLRYLQSFWLSGSQVAAWIQTGRHRLHDGTPDGYDQAGGRHQGETQYDPTGSERR